MTGFAVAMGVLAAIAVVVAVLSLAQLATARRTLVAVSEQSADQARSLASLEQAHSEAVLARTAAEERASGVEERATAAEGRADEAEAGVATAEQQAADAQARAEAAEARAAAAETDAVSTRERATSAEEDRASSEERARDADQRASDAESERDLALGEANTAREAARAAEERAVAAESRAAADSASGAGTRTSVEEPSLAPSPIAASPGEGLDGMLLWALEQMRTERTWRQSVAVGNEGVSVFDTTDDPLLEALHVEVDALREDVGAVIDLDVDLPGTVGAAGSVMVLRVAQEMLAGVVRRSEETMLRIAAEDRDVLVTVQSVDEAGHAVEPMPTLTEPSPAAEPIVGGVRIRNVLMRR